MNFVDQAQPGNYQIKVAGTFDKSWSKKLANMQVSLEDGSIEKKIYNLIGKLKDQAELNGILNTLYELHLTIISINLL
jgi:hypothetical protein